ncbi:hypothetical protein [Metabacillus litoralis]|nr:hypothetical protein [Metabacillus litoralis]MCM3164106.1 hypothetical protein [Metabacillus litoralis]
MMIAMTNGMSVGLFLGVIFGILQSGTLLLTTMIGINLVLSFYEIESAN